MYLDYPLGQTAGRAGDLQEQQSILSAVCQAFEAMTEPGTIHDLPLQWSQSDAWKDAVMRPSAATDPEPASEEEKRLSGDQRTQRHASPQYQFSEDRDSANPQCPSCIFLE